MLVVGSYITFKIILHLHISIKSNAVINVDKLVLIDQAVNILIVPVIAIQLLRSMYPHWVIFDSIDLLLVVQGFMNIALFHRAISGLGMAGIRKVSSNKYYILAAFL